MYDVPSEPIAVVLCAGWIVVRLLCTLLLFASYIVGVSRAFTNVYSQTDTNTMCGVYYWLYSICYVHVDGNIIMGGDAVWSCRENHGTTCYFHASKLKQICELSKFPLYFGNIPVSSNQFAIDQSLVGTECQDRAKSEIGQMTRRAGAPLGTSTLFAHKPLWISPNF